MTMQFNLHMHGTCETCQVSAAINYHYRVYALCYSIKSIVWHVYWSSTIFHQVDMLSVCIFSVYFPWIWRLRCISDITVTFKYMLDRGPILTGHSKIYALQNNYWEKGAKWARLLFNNAYVIYCFIYENTWEKLLVKALLLKSVVSSFLFEPILRASAVSLLDH